jgi:hypothetical protein
MGFNKAQLATLTEARALAEELKNYGLIINSESEDQNKSGIYLPDWRTEGGPSPNEGDALWYHFRFTNGADGVNVGLIQDRLSRYPNSPAYVFRSLVEEINQIVAANQQRQ